MADTRQQMHSNPISAATVRRLEWESILKTREVNHRPTPNSNSQEWDRALTGLALSGGGIRSATFHLGVLQVLAEHKMLPGFDYISAVSGGGFIAGWLCKLIHTYARTPATSQPTTAPPPDEFPSHPDTAPPQPDPRAADAETVSPTTLGNRADAITAVSRRLRPRPGRECPQVHWLRQHLTYLTPGGGPLAQSSWLFVAIYLHNLAINFLILSTAVAALLIAPRLVLSVLHYLMVSKNGLASASATIGAAMIFGNVILVILGLILHRLRSVKADNKRSLPILSALASAVVLPIFFRNVVASALLPNPLMSVVLAIPYAALARIYWNLTHTSNRAKNRFIVWSSLIGVFLLSPWSFVSAQTLPQLVLSRPFDYSRHLWESYVKHLSTFFQLVDISSVNATAIAQVIVIAVFMMLLSLSSWLMSTHNVSKFWYLENTRVFDVVKFSIASWCVVCINTAGIDALQWLNGLLKSKWPPPLDVFIAVVVFFVPLLAACTGLAFNLLIAVLGRIISHYIRFMIADLTTILYRYIFIWTLVSTVALYGPVVVCETGRRVHSYFWAIWILATLVGFAIRREPGFRVELLRRLAALFFGFVPYIFFFCYALFTSFAINAYVYGFAWRGTDEYWDQTLQTLHPGTLVLITITAALAFLLSARFGVNSPSMHMFYQARIADAYLREVLPGGEVAADFINSAREQSGLSKSSLKLEELTIDQTPGYNGPYLLLNATLNMVSTEEPAWQDRRAANFVFSPLYCGYEPARLRSRVRALSKNAYRKTSEYRYGTERGIRIAQAMSISGSAIGSSMGYHTSPRVRFLHTVLNLRLGWWFANPRFPRSWAGLTPRSRLGLLLSELAGRTHDHGPVVHLSDGGHFENLGLYELVRRRCRFILVSDASEDRFGYARSLGNAIERCRTDFGIEIYLNLSDLHGNSNGDKMSMVIGRILYGPNRVGVIVYIRPALTGSEPIDILTYAKLHSRFPHESTANQWFKESQFESYRRLGIEAGRSVAIMLDTYGGPDGIASIPKMVLDNFT